MGNDMRSMQDMFNGTPSDFKPIPLTETQMAELFRLRAENESLRQQLDSLEAARFAYASEFGVAEDGMPDKGSIHQNIRLLKKQLEEAKQQIWLLRKLAKADDSDVSAGRPCDGPNGCNSHNCIGCGEQAMKERQ